MPAQKYLNRVSGRNKQIAATITSAGAADDGKLVGLDATGRIDGSMMPVGLAADTKSIIASEALAAGNLVSLFDNAGVTNVRKADATVEGKECDGFVLSSVSAAAAALVYFEGRITGLSGLTLGARYYLSITAGAITATPVSASGNVDQYVGKAVSATELNFEPDDGVTLA
jgi:hypothetical protein